MSAVRVSVRTHGNDGEFNGVVEVDSYENTVFLEVFDHSYANGTSSAACVELSIAEAREVAAALSRVEGAVS